MRIPFFLLLAALLLPAPAVHAASIERIMSSEITEPPPPTTLIDQIRDASLEMDGRSDIRVNRLDTLTDRITRKDGLDEHGQQNMTPLHMAASQNDVELVQLLLDNGADAYALDDNGRSPLGSCLPWGHETMNQLLHYYKAQGRYPDDWSHGGLLNQLTWYGSSSYGFIEIAMGHGLAVSPDTLSRLETEASRSPERKMQLDTFRRLLAARAAGTLTVPAAPVLNILPPAENAPLITAVMAGNIDEVKRLLESGASANTISRTPVDMRSGRINVSQEDRDTLPTAARPALSLAIMARRSDIAGLLLDKGANPDLRGANWRNWGKDGCETPLILAVRNDDADMVKALLAKGADVNRTECQWNLPPLAYAKTVSMAERLLAAGADVNIKGRYSSVLSQMMYDHPPELLDYLLDHGGDANQRIDGLGNQQTLLMKVADESRIDIAFARLLLRHGADPAARDLTGASAFDIATNRGRTDMVALLGQKGLSYGDMTGAFYQAIERDDLAEVEKIIAAGFDLKAVDERMGSPMQAAARAYLYSQPYQTGTTRADARTTAMLRLLMSRGADVKTTDGSGRTLLHLVADPDFAADLVKAGVDVNAGEGSGGDTALHQYARVAQVEMVRRLIALKADVNLRNKRGETALMQALEGPIDHRPADGPPPNWEVEVPLYLETIRLLVQAGATLTPQEFASATGHRFGGDATEYQDFLTQARQAVALKE